MSSSLIPHSIPHSIPRCIEAMNKAFVEFGATPDDEKRVHASLSYVINLKVALDSYDTEGRIRAEPLTHEFYHVCMEHLREHMGVTQWAAFTTLHGYDKVLDH